MLVAFAGLLLAAPAFARSATQTPLTLDGIYHNSAQASNISSCTGYTLRSVSETKTGLTAQLTLTGNPCHVFSDDISNLTIKITYETITRLHVNIFDSDDEQYTIPDSVISRPPPPTTSLKDDSDLVFNYEPSPFASIYL